MFTAHSRNFNPEGRAHSRTVWHCLAQKMRLLTRPFTLLLITGWMVSSWCGMELFHLGRFHRFQLTFLATKKGDIALSPLTQAKKKKSLLYIPLSLKIWQRILVRLFGNWRWCC